MIVSLSLFKEGQLIEKFYTSLRFFLIIALFYVVSSCTPCDGDCGGGTFCCPNPSGPGGTCCENGQICASTGGRFPGPLCEDAPKESKGN